MSKRYTDTSLYDREWFQELSPKYKCFWEYICKKCDHAGIWDVNLRLASFCIGEKIIEDEIFKVFDDKIFKIEGDKWWIPKFVKFQYGLVLNHENRVHKSVIAILEKYDLINKEGHIQIQGKQENENVAKENIKRIKKTNIKGFISPTMEEVIDYFKEQKYVNPEEEAGSFWRYYENTGWKVGRSKMKNWHLAAGNWNKNAKERMPSGKKENSRVFIQQSHKDKRAKW